MSTKEKIILGKNAIFSSDSRKTGLNNNVLVVGPSGCGKTYSLIEPHILNERDTSLVITATKRRIVDMYSPFLSHRGYEVAVLDLVSPDRSTVAFDPMCGVEGYDDITSLAKAIVRADPRKGRCNSDPYWDTTSEDVLSAEIAYALMTTENPTFEDVLSLHDQISLNEESNMVKTTIDDKFEDLEELAPGCFAVSRWKTFHNISMRTASCIFSTLNTSINAIFTPELRRMIARERPIDVNKLATKKTALFLITSPVNKALNSFANIFYGHLFKKLFEFGEMQSDGKLPVPVDVLCDDFATGGRIAEFPEYISIFREKGISVTLLIQSESQLARMYGTEDATTIINNCDTYVYMGGMDLLTARHISERLNTPLEDVLYMAVGKEFIFRRGQKPIITERYPITEDKQYQKLKKDYEESASGGRSK